MDLLGCLCCPVAYLEPVTNLGQHTVHYTVKIVPVLLWSALVLFLDHKFMLTGIETIPHLTEGDLVFLRHGAIVVFEYVKLVHDRRLFQTQFEYPF